MTLYSEPPFVFSNALSKTTQACLQGKIQRQFRPTRGVVMVIDPLLFLSFFDCLLAVHRLDASSSIYLCMPSNSAFPVDIKYRICEMSPTCLLRSNSPRAYAIGSPRVSLGIWYRLRKIVRHKLSTRWRWMKASRDRGAGPFLDREGEGRDADADADAAAVLVEAGEARRRRTEGRIGKSKTSQVTCTE